MSGLRTAALVVLLIAGSAPFVSRPVAAQPAIIVTASIAPPPLPVGMNVRRCDSEPIAGHWALSKWHVSAASG